MKIIILGIIFSLLFSAAAKPGGSYILTGREKSIFSIFQTDLKAHPELYAGEDVNAYYQEFKAANNLGERKLKLGEELVFPDTPMSKKIRQAEMEKAAQAAAEIARAAEKAEIAEARALGKEAPAPPPAAQESSGQVTLFGSDRRAAIPMVSSPETERARAEAQREAARHKSIYYYQHTLLPLWVFDYTRDIVENIEKENIVSLVEQAQEQVDEPFAKALVLHSYPDKKIFVLEFESPKKVGEYYFFAVKRAENGRASFFSMEKGLSFFGTGDESVLHEWQSGREFSNLGGRKYKDLSSFLQELELGPFARSFDE